MNDAIVLVVNMNVSKNKKHNHRDVFVNHYTIFANGFTASLLSYKYLMWTYEQVTTINKVISGVGENHITNSKKHDAITSCAIMELKLVWIYHHCSSSFSFIGYNSCYKYNL